MLRFFERLGICFHPAALTRSIACVFSIDGACASRRSASIALTQSDIETPLQANLDMRWRTGDAKCWEEDVPIEPNGDSGKAAATTIAAPPAPPRAAATGGPVVIKSPKEKPKIYIIEPKEKK